MSAIQQGIKLNQQRWYIVHNTKKSADYVKSIASKESVNSMTKSSKKIDNHTCVPKYTIIEHLKQQGCRLKLKWLFKMESIQPFNKYKGRTRWIQKKCQIWF